MTRYKKKLLIKIVSVILLFSCCIITVGTVVGRIYSKISFYTDYVQKFYDSHPAFQNMLCINLPTSYFDQQYEALKKELEQLPYFVTIGRLGPDYVVSDIYYGDTSFTPEYIQNTTPSPGDASFSVDTSKIPQGITHINLNSLEYESYKLDNTMINQGFIKLIKGHSFSTAEVHRGREIPLIVTEGFPFKVGDRVTVTLVNSKESMPITATAYIKGICSNDRYLPLIRDDFKAFIPSYQKPFEIVYLPEMSTVYPEHTIYKEHSAYSMGVPAYVIFNDDLKNINEYFRIIEKYAIIEGVIPHEDLYIVQQFESSGISVYKLSLYLFCAMGFILCIFFVLSILMLSKRWNNEKLYKKEKEIAL